VIRRWSDIMQNKRWSALFRHSIFALLVAAVPVAASAQVSGSPREARGNRADDPRRAELEKRFQQRVETMLRQRLQLTDDQATKLRDVASRAETSRRALRHDEMQARKQMRDELLAGDNANNVKVAELLEEMPRLERRRIELMEQEQRDLAKFLSPVQRARYFALQDELRRNMQEVQRRRMGAPDSSNASEKGRFDMPRRRRPPVNDR
jgi:protein CpxP